MWYLLYGTFVKRRKQLKNLFPWDVWHPSWIIQHILGKQALLFIVLYISLVLTDCDCYSSNNSVLFVRLITWLFWCPPWWYHLMYGEVNILFFAIHIITADGWTVDTVQWTVWYLLAKIFPKLKNMKIEKYDSWWLDSVVSFGWPGYK